MTQEEKTLVQGLRNGEEQAYRQLYAQYFVYLCYMAESFVHDSFLAKTIVQDFMFSFWKHREQLTVTTSLKAYLTRAVRNCCTNYIVAEKRHPTLSLSQLSAEGYDTGNAPVCSELTSDEVEATDMHRQVEAILDGLSAECRSVFQKSRFEGMTYSEIAAENNISVNTVKYHLKNALARMRKGIVRCMLCLP